MCVCVFKVCSYLALDLLARYKFIYESQMPCVWLIPPQSKWKCEGLGGALVEKAEQSSILRRHHLCGGTSTPPTSKKMEPGPYFNIKNALNGFTYNLVPEGH